MILFFLLFFFFEGFFYERFMGDEYGRECFFLGWIVFIFNLIFGYFFYMFYNI